MPMAVCKKKKLITNIIAPEEGEGSSHKEERREATYTAPRSIGSIEMREGGGVLHDVRYSTAPVKTSAHPKSSSGCK